MPDPIEPTLATILSLAITHSASDILLSPNTVPYVRIDGQLIPVQHTEPLKHESVKAMAKSVMSEKLQTTLEEKREVDFSFTFDKVRFRVNAFYQRGMLSLSLRLIPHKIKTYEELGLPPIIKRFAQAKRGFLVVAGPTGHGKSTTLATIVDDINTNQSGHIITIEDPIEYVFENKKSVISQREVGIDTETFGGALRSAVREDPNVILAGEMRDQESAETALALAETGHLVFTTLHTNSAGQAADRMINMFPTVLQESVRQQLANVLLGVISQRLIPKIGGGRVLATEILIATPAVRSIIREDKTHQLDNVIATSAADGMMSLDKVLAELISRGEITLEDGLQWANDPKSLKSLLY